MINRMGENRKVWPWVIGGAAALLVVGTAATIPIAVNAQQEAAEERQIADEAAAAEEAERERLATFQRSLDACNLFQGERTGVYVLDGGEALEFDGASQSFQSATQIEDVYCVLDELGAPASLESKIGTTRALDGRQEDEWDALAVEWSYHPDSGLNLLVEYAG